MEFGLTVVADPSTAVRVVVMESAIQLKAKAIVEILAVTAAGTALVPVLYPMAVWGRLLMSTVLPHAHADK